MSTFGGSTVGVNECDVTIVLRYSRSLPLEGMKRKIMRNLRTLEQEGMVNSTNDYQEIINAIAKVADTILISVHPRLFQTVPT